MRDHNLELAFLDEILHNPADETAVLIYADWLCDQDDPAAVSRGEFLRLESILKRGRPGAQRGDMEWQARQLWWDHIEEWLGPLYDAVDHFRYERGLLSIEVSDASLTAMSADALAQTRAWDWVRHVGVRQGGFDALVRLSELPRPRYLTSIDVGRKILDDPSEELPGLLELPILHGLMELNLAENALKNAGCARLSVWSGLGTLRKLSLSKNEISCPGVRFLLDSPFLGELEELDLSGNFIGNYGAQELCISGAVPKLQRLDLRTNDLDWHDVARLQKRFDAGVQIYPLRRQTW